MEVPKIYPRSSEINFEAVRSFDWEGDVLSVTDSIVSAFRDASDQQVLQHYKTDFTELREFLEAKRAGKELRPVVRGKWIPDYDYTEYDIDGSTLLPDPRKFQDGWQCSLCGKYMPYKDNFCPNCGADMREES